MKIKIEQKAIDQCPVIAGWIEMSQDIVSMRAALLRAEYVRDLIKQSITEASSEKGGRA